MIIKPKEEYNLVENDLYQQEFISNYGKIDLLQRYFYLVNYLYFLKKSVV